MKITSLKIKNRSRFLYVGKENYVPEISSEHHPECEILKLFPLTLDLRLILLNDSKAACNKSPKASVTD